MIGIYKFNQNNLKNFFFHFILKKILKFNKKKH